MRVAQLQDRREDEQVREQSRRDRDVENDLERRVGAAVEEPDRDEAERRRDETRHDVKSSTGTSPMKTARVGAAS